MVNHLYCVWLSNFQLRVCFSPLTYLQISNGYPHKPNYNIIHILYIVIIIYLMSG